MTLYKNIKQLPTGLFRLFVLMCVLPSLSLAQNITVKPVKINQFDESSYAPSVKDGWLYFASNKKRKTINSVQTESGENFYDLYKVKIKEKNKINSKIIPFSDAVNRKFNETSSCFSGNDFYFSSNSFYEVNKNEVGNYGIYVTQLEEGAENTITPFIYNDKNFNVAHPTINEGGDLLVFASDNNSGKGKSDLYFCKLIDQKWSAPQNLGKEINTKFMETFPKLHGTTLYFSSDRDGGLGGLDIYKTTFTDSQWTTPEVLPEPINSTHDDFGYTANLDLKSGYFSSNRIQNKDGIFYFEYDMPIMHDFYPQELYFCYTLEETKMKETDSLKFKWKLGNGDEADGAIVNYCYADTGTYKVSMSILDKHTGTVFEEVSSYDIIIDAFNMPVIDIVDLEEGVVKVIINNKWTNKTYTNKYWLVEDNFIFEDELILNFRNKTEFNVKLVVWNTEVPDSAIGIERIVYK